MKRILNYFLICALFICTLVPAKASNYSLKPSAREVKVGETVTITASVFDTETWELRMTSSGGNLSGTTQSADAEGEEVSKQVLSATFSADEPGEYTIYLNGSIAGSDEVSAGDFYSVSDSVTIKVVSPQPDPTPDPDPEPTPEPEPTPDPEPEEEEKSDDARLYSLTVDKGTLTPNFSSEVYTYTVDLTSEDTEITIKASSWDDKASVTGTGLKPLKIGSNSFTVDVTAEDGETRKAYTINVNVKEVASIFFDFEDKKLGILGEVENADIPKGFKETTITVQDTEVKAFVNAKETMTLLYMSDENENKGFYVYDKEAGICGLYRPLMIGGKEFFIINIPDKFRSVEQMNFNPLTVGEETFDGWSFNETDFRNYSLMYLMNAKGEMGYYVYDSLENKIVSYPEDLPLTAEDLIAFIEQKPETPWLLYAGIGVGVVVIIAIIGFVVYKKKNSNKNKYGDEYDDDDDFEPVASRDSGHKLVTDDTFFKEVPHEAEDVEEESEPLTIESILNSLTKEELEKTYDEPEAEDTPMVEEDEDDEDDDWLDEKLMNIFTDDDEE